MIRFLPVRPAAMMDEAEADVIASLAFPKSHWLKLQSTNTIERLTKELKRRADVPRVGLRHPGLPADDPKVAPSYAAHRSALAKSLGLARKGVESAPTSATEIQPAPEVEAQPETEAPKKAGRGRKKA